MGWCGYARRWIGDDGFINLRVVEQLLAGHGFVFNAGERSEAVTSPAWVAILWLAGALGAAPADAAWMLGLGLSILGLGLSGCAGLLLRAPAERSSTALPLGLLCFACLPPAWDYATSGLENGLGLAFLGGCFFLVARASRPGSSPAAAALAAFALSFAPLIRPDYELLAAPLLALLCLHGRGLLRRLQLLGLGLSAGACHELFRMGYFASLVPNTALAKQAFETRWPQGLHYLWNTVGLYWLLVPASSVVLLLALDRGWSRSAGSAEARQRTLGLRLALFAAGLLHIAYIVGIGGDFMHARLLLPGSFTLFSALPLVELGDRRLAVRGLTALAALSVYIWCIVCATTLRVPGENQFGIGDERGWYVSKSRFANPTHIENYRKFYFYRDAKKMQQRLANDCAERAPGLEGGAAGCRRVLLTSSDDGVLSDRPPSALLELADAAAPDSVASVVATRPLGIAAAVLGLQVNLVDFFGLADPVAARLTLARRRRPGHEKAFDTPWQAARYAAPESSADERVLAARHALACGKLAQLERATHEPLTWSRFFRNVKLAVTLNGLRVPRDHFEAEEAFCAAPGFGR